MAGGFGVEWEGEEVKHGTHSTPLRTAPPPPPDLKLDGLRYNAMRMPKPEPFDREPAGEIDGVPVYRVPLGAQCGKWA